MAIVLAASTLARPAWADATIVVVAQRTPAAPEADRLVHRLEGELAADGITGTVADMSDSGDTDAALVSRARAAGATVAAELVVGSDARTVDLTIVDAATARALHRRIEVDEETERTAPEVLARRSVDLLRASLLDFLLESVRVAMSRAEASKAQPAAPPARPPPPRKSHSFGLSLDGGLGVLASFDGVGPALVPVVRVGVALDRRWAIRASGAWLGTRPSVAAAAGSATVDQGLGLFELVASPWVAPVVRPTATLGVGVYSARVSGDAAPPSAGANASKIAAALSAGAGLAVRIAPSLDVRVEATAIVTSPGLAVRFDGDTVARIGRPSLLAAATLGGWP